MPLEFDPKSHTYRYNGFPVPNVTGVLEPLIDFSAVPTDVLERARQVGTAVHTATELFDIDDLDDDSIDPVIAPYLSAWKKFRIDTGFVPDFIECRVFSKRHWYAGTLDRIGRFKHGLESAGIKHKDLCLLDIKATSQIPPSAGPQTAAYAEAFNYRRADKIIHRFACQLRPNGTYRLELFTHHASDLSVFLACLTIHNWRNAA